MVHRTRLFSGKPKDTPRRFESSPKEGKGGGPYPLYVIACLGVAVLILVLPCEKIEKWLFILTVATILFADTMKQIGKTRRKSQHSGSRLAKSLKFQLVLPRNATVYTA
jgi:hypothetical protein